MEHESIQRDEKPVIAGIESLTCGDTVDRYRLLEYLGRGGMGVVFKASHAMFPKRLYAIKFVRRDASSDGAIWRFQREIRAMDELRHPHIVYASDAGVHQGVPFLVMEYVDGVTLQQLVKRYQRLDCAAACEMIRQAALGLNHAFEKCLVHRDLKPSNLMLARDGTVKVMDLGLARLRGATVELTASGQIMGTPDYMAPEQWESPKYVDVRSDIYSLGCTLYCLLAGHPPFGEERYSALPSKLKAHLTVDPTSILELRDDIPADLGTLLHRMLAKLPADRMQTPRDVSQGLLPFCADAELASLLQADLPLTASLQNTCSIAQRNTDREESNADATTPRIVETAHHDVKSWRFRGAVAAAVIIFCLLAIGSLVWRTGVRDALEAWWPATADSVTTEPAGSNAAITVDRFGIQRFRYLSSENAVANLGIIGTDSFAADLGDLVRITMALSEPAYCYLMALNPSDDRQLNCQLCFPASEDEQPPLLVTLEYPTTKTSYYPLDDGAGQQVFVLLASRTSLPPFRDWRASHPAAFQASDEQQGGVWVFNGKELEQKLPTGQVRSGEVSVVPQALDTMVQSLQRDSQVDAIQAVAFPVRGCDSDQTDQSTE